MRMVGLTISLRGKVPKRRVRGGGAVLVLPLWCRGGCQSLGRCRHPSREARGVRGGGRIAREERRRRGELEGRLARGAHLWGGGVSVRVCGRRGGYSETLGASTGEELGILGLERGRMSGITRGGRGITGVSQGRGDGTKDSHVPGSPWLGCCAAWRSSQTQVCDRKHNRMPQLSDTFVLSFIAAMHPILMMLHAGAGARDVRQQWRPPGVRPVSRGLDAHPETPPIRHLKMSKIDSSFVFPIDIVFPESKSFFAFDGISLHQEPPGKNGPNDGRGVDGASCLGLLRHRREGQHPGALPRPASLARPLSRISEVVIPLSPSRGRGEWWSGVERRGGERERGSRALHLAPPSPPRVSGHSPARSAFPSPPSSPSSDLAPLCMYFLLLSSAKTPPPVSQSGKMREPSWSNVEASLASFFGRTKEVIFSLPPPPSPLAPTPLNSSPGNLALVRISEAFSSCR